MWRFRFVYLISLAGTVVFHLIYAGALSWFVLLAVALLPLLSIIFSLPAMLMARLSLSAPPSVKCGEKALLSVSVSNGWAAPAALIRLRVRTNNVFTGETKLHPTMFFYAAWEQTQSVELDTAHSGKVTFTVEKAWVTDYLGLIALPMKKPLPAAVYVYPTPVRPPKIAQVLRNLKQRLIPKRGGGFSEEHELRPYREGDPISGIHWKLSSKLDETIVREPMETEKKRIVISIELKGSPSDLNDVLGQLMWLSGALIEKGLLHSILNPYASSRRLLSTTPDDEGQLNDYVKELLQYRAAGKDALARQAAPLRADRYFVLKAQRGEKK